MISFRMSRPAQLVHGPRSGPLETSSHRRHHGAGHNEVPTPERTMSPVRHKNIALVGKAAIREHGVIAAATPLGLWRSDRIDLLMKSH